MLNQYSQQYTYEDCITFEYGRFKATKFHQSLVDKNYLEWDAEIDHYSHTSKGVVFGKIYHDFLKDKQAFNLKNKVTPIYKQSDIIVVVDTREQNFNRIEKQLADWGVTAISRKLPSGDYIFIKRPPNGVISHSLNSTTMYPYVIERKTLVDFEKSINDGRWKSQKRRMLNVLHRRGLYILVEGLESNYKKTSNHTVLPETLRMLLMDKMRHNNIPKILVIYGVDELRKSLCKTANTYLKDYIQHHQEQTPLKHHYSHADLTLAQHIDITLIDYYLLHIQAILGTKIYESPNSVALQNLNTLVDNRITNNNDNYRSSSQEYYVPNPKQ
eukprot:gene7887-9258_t